MKKHQLIAFILISALLFYPLHILKADLSADDRAVRQLQIIGSRTMSLDTRHPAPYANEVYRDNILLTISYMTGQTKPGQTIDWEAVRRPGSYKWILPAGRTFAFHDGVLPQFQNSIAGTTNAHFGGNEGFKSDGYLVGNGVCHLASLMGWTAKDAKLDVVAPTNHDFAVIPEVPREQGIAIYSTPDNPAAGVTQNLYVTNNTGHEVAFTFTYDGHSLTAAVEE